MSHLSHFKKFLIDFWQTYFTVLKLIVPVVLVLKLLSYTSVIGWFGVLLKPVMSFLGLPPEAGIVIATTMSTSIYSGMLTWISLPNLLHLTMVQATVITGMMLYAHTFLIEIQVAKKAGIPKRFSLLWRILGAFLFGFFIHTICSIFGVLDSPAVILFKPETVDPSLLGWSYAQIQNLLKIGTIIFVLMIVMSILRYLKITHALEFLLKPFLCRIGISGAAISLTIVGLVLGLFYGGALIIREANLGVLSQKDVFYSMAFLSLCHSLFEDSFLGVVMGGNFYILLIGRLIFAYCAVYVLYKLTQLPLLNLQEKLQ